MGYDVLARAVVSEYSFISTHQTHYTISLKDEPVFYQSIKKEDLPNLRLTRGMYFVRYHSPKSLYITRKGRADTPFTIGTDLLGFHLSVRSAKHLHILAKSLPEVAWMIRNTNYSDELFQIAMNHVGMCIPFSHNVAKYHAKLKKKVIEQGEKFPDLFAGLLSYNCAQDVAENFTKTIPAPPTAEYYKKELADAILRAPFEPNPLYRYKTDKGLKGAPYQMRASDYQMLMNQGFIPAEEALPKIAELKEKERLYREKYVKKNKAKYPNARVNKPAETVSTTTTTTQQQTTQEGE